ncbi:MAG: Sec-independent protein translocase protein TatB [Beijerinckiaceae bacterium]
MFDIGGGELLVIGIVALVVIGPKELPGLLRTAGNAMGKVRRMAAEFRGQFDEAMREAELDKAKQAFTDAADAAQSVKPTFNPLDTIRNEIQSVKDEIKGAKDAAAAPGAPAPEPKFDPPPPAPPVDIKAAAAPPAPAAEPEPAPKPKRSRKKAGGDGAAA